jgi:hypothetical protein
MLTELEKDKAAGRKAALTKAVDFGRVEAFYLSFGSTIADLCDNASATVFPLPCSGVGSPSN